MKRSFEAPDLEAGEQIVLHRAGVEGRAELELVAEEPLAVVEEDEGAGDVGAAVRERVGPVHQRPVGVPVELGVVEPVAQDDRAAEAPLGLEAEALDVLRRGVVGRLVGARPRDRGEVASPDSPTNGMPVSGGHSLCTIS